MASSWPPESVSIHTEDLINQCESMEVLPSLAEGKQFVPVVELAALLYTGEYVHARHLWRRWKDCNPSSYLVDWWTVGAAMMAPFFGTNINTATNTTTSIKECAATIWTGLAHIQNTHPAPFCHYAEQVGNAYRRRIVQCHSFQKDQHQRPPQPYWTLLNLESTEWEQFCLLEHDTPSTTTRTTTSTSRAIMDANKTSSASLRQVVAVLESNPPL